MDIEQIIFSTAIKDGMPQTLAKLLVAQSKVETNNYQHRFFTIGLNAFGYSYVPGAKWQLDRGGPLADNGVPIAQYSSIENSVHEIASWIKRRQAEGKFPANLNEITTPDEYATLLKNAGYYQADLSTYTGALLYWFENLPPLQAALIIGGGTLILLVLGAILFRKQIF